MSTYVRFILLVLIGGSVVSLAIVVLSNDRSRREQQIKIAQERATLGDAARNMSDRLRYAQVAINGQKIDANGKILETSLLIRQLTYKLEPLPMTEVVIPGSILCIDGIDLEFGENYPEAYKEMRGRRLVMLMHVSGQEQVGAPFSLWPGWVDGVFIVPEAMQVHVGKDAHVTYFETKLWSRVWELLGSTPQARAKADFNVVTSKEIPGLKTCVEVFLKDIRHSGFYDVAIGPLEGVTITESGKLDERRKMLEEWDNRNKLK